MRTSWTISFVLMTWILGAMTSEAAAGQKIALSCAFENSQGKLPSGAEDMFCSALEQYLKADFGLSFAQAGAAGHRLAVTVSPRSTQAFDISVRAAPLRGGGESSTSMVLVAHDSGLTAFSAKTLVLPIRRQLGLVD